jgi:hypothetical protein
MDPENERPDIAFYYPNPTWYSGDWIKSLILFFDGVGLLVPSYMKDAPEFSDPAIFQGLREHGLLHILEPETLVDKSATEALATTMTNIIASGALDALAKDGTDFAELSYSRLGGYGDHGLAQMILTDLKARGLAKDSRDGVSIPMHPMVRSLVLVLLAQILKPQGERIGLELSPATDRPEIVAALKNLLSIPGFPSAGHVVSSDLNLVGVDLGLVPMDEILSFRRSHIQEHRAYVRAVRKFVRDLSLLPAGDAASAVAERREELNDLAAGLRNASESAWRQPATLGLSLAGAAWSYVAGDPIAAIIAAGSALASLAPAQRPEVGAYSFLFEAQGRYGRR